VVVSVHSTTARSWPDPNLNNRWLGVATPLWAINSPVPQRLVTVGAGRLEPDGGKTAAGTGQNPKCPEKGGRQRVVWHEDTGCRLR